MNIQNKLSDHVLSCLLTGEDPDWMVVSEQFNINPLGFEHLLFKLHFKRLSRISEASRKVILQFLCKGYCFTNDIRYYNEFLWFYKDSNDLIHLQKKCVIHFRNNLDAFGSHSLPSYLTKPEENSSQYGLNDTYKTGYKRKKICLLGFPPFFGRIHKELVADGFEVEQFFIPYHPNKKIKVLLGLKPIVKMISWISGNWYPYTTLDYHYKDPKITEKLKERNFDVGFHKLNCIIKNNIISCFKDGLLNDHWGILPTLRGKSTIAYSLLLGLPVMSTVHYIDEGVDTGPILCYYPIATKQSKSINEIRNKFRRTLPKRIVQTIKYACHPDSNQIINAINSGLTFYEIHPTLIHHIENIILKKEHNSVLNSNE